VPLLGRLGDIFGRRRLLFVALGAFALGSVICALADSMGGLIAGRIVQGLGAAVGPLALGIARSTLPPERLTRALGILVGAAGAGAAIGYLVSGVLVDQISVAAIFWFLFAVALVLMAAAAFLVPAVPTGVRVPVDLAGAALVGSGLAALLLTISKGNDWGWSSARVLGLLCISALLLIAFVLVENRVRPPLIELGFVAARPFADANVCAFAVGYAFAIVVIAVPQLAALPEVTGYGLGYSTTATGLLLLPMATFSIASAWIAGRIVDSTGPRVLMATGAAAALAGYVSLGAAHGTAAQIAAATAALGVAVGLTITGIASVVVRRAAIDKTSVAAAVNGIIRTTGTAVGAAATAAIITGAGTAGPFPVEDAYTRSFVMGAIVSGIALLGAALLPGRPARAPAGS
jgi:MFS family permease